jgi:hypothetical protein
MAFGGTLVQAITDAYKAMLIFWDIPCPYKQEKTKHLKNIPSIRNLL